MRDFKVYLDVWKKNLGEVLGNNEFTINEIHKKLKKKHNVRRETVSRWVNILILDGFLVDRWDGREHYARVKRNITAASSKGVGKTKKDDSKTDACKSCRTC